MAARLNHCARSPVRALPRVRRSACGPARTVRSGVAPAAAISLASIALNSENLAAYVRIRRSALRHVLGFCMGDRFPHAPRALAKDVAGRPRRALAHVRSIFCSRLLGLRLEALLVGKCRNALFALASQGWV